MVRTLLVSIRLKFVIRFFSPVRIPLSKYLETVDRDILSIFATSPVEIKRSTIFANTFIVVSLPIAFRLGVF